MGGAGGYCPRSQCATSEHLKARSCTSRGEEGWVGERGLEGREEVMPHLQQVFIAHHVLQFGVLWHVLPVCEDDVTLDGRKLALHLDHKIHKGEVQCNVLVLGVVHNVFQLLLKQPA